MPTLRNKLPRLRIKAEFGTPEFETEVLHRHADRAIGSPPIADVRF
jgi:hypothetical protein